MSEMRKFERTNKLTNEKEEMISCSGVLTTFSEEPLENKVSGKLYHRFTAKVDTSRGESVIGGQLYQGLVPFLGGYPKVGERLNFTSKVEDLKEGYNTRRIT